MADNRTARVHAPAFLQTISVGFRAPGMIADRLAPRVRVRKQSDKYRIWGKNNLVDRSAATPWAPGTIPNAIETRWSEATYFADLHKLRMALLDAELANADDGLDLRGNYTEIVTNAVAIARESRVAALFRNTANYSAGNIITKAGGAEWNTVPASVLTDLDTAITRAKATTFRPSSDLSVVVPDQIYDQAFKRNTNILDTIKYSERGVVSTDLVAQLLGVKEVILASSVAVAAGPENAATDIVTGYTATSLWGDDVWVGLIAEGENDMAPTFARSFNWTAATDGQERRVREYRMADEGQEGNWIEVTEAIGEAIVFKDAGVIIKNTSSTI